jgi:hypothetical protein
LTEKPPPGYVVLSNGLVREDKLKEIRGKVEAQMGPISRLSLSEAVRIVEAEGVADATHVFEVLGYKVLWRGINAEKAEVVRR